MRYWIFSLTLFFIGILSGKTIYVDKTGSNLNNGLSKSTISMGVGPKATINAAVILASKYDTIVVNTGSYLESVKLSKDLFICTNGQVIIKSTEIDGSGIQVDFFYGNIQISDSLNLKNGEFYIRSKSNFYLGLNSEIIGGYQSSFIIGRIHKIFDQYSGVLEFPIGFNHSYRPVLVEMVDNVSKLDTVCVEMIDSAYSLSKYSGIQNVNARYYCQLRFFQCSNNRYKFTQYFGSYFVDDQIIDSVNLRLLNIQNGKFYKNGICDSLKNGNGRVSGIFNFNGFWNNISLCNLTNGANAMGNNGVFAFFQSSKNKYCLGEYLKLDNSSIVNGSRYKSCVWYFDYPKIGKRNSQTSFNTNYLLRDTGTMKVWLIMTDSLLRVDTFVANLSVVGTKAKLNISNICLGGKAKLYISGLPSGSFGVTWYQDSIFKSIDDTLFINKLDKSRTGFKLLVQSLIENCDYFLDSQLNVVSPPSIKFVKTSDSCNSNLIWFEPEIDNNSLSKQYKYHWYVDGILRDSMSKFGFNTIDILNHKLKLEVTNQFNCASSRDTSFIKKRLKLNVPQISLNCIADIISIKLSVNSSVNSKYQSYWYLNDSLVSKLKDSTVFSRSIKKTDCKMVSINERGCSDSISIDLSKYTKTGSELIVKDIPHCISDSLEMVVLRNGIIDTTGIFKINNDIYSANPLKIKIANAGYQNIIWQTNSYGCNDLLSNIVYFSAIPVHSITLLNNRQFVCALDTVNIELNGIDPTDTMLYLQSIYSDNVTSNIGRLKYLTYTKEKINFYSLVKNKRSGCEFKDTFNLIVNQLPSIKIIIDSLLCFGDHSKIETFDISQTKSSRLNWRINLNNQDHFTDSYDFGVLPVGSYRGFVTVKDSIGCSDSNTILVKVQELPNYNVKLNGQMPICFGDSLTINLSSSNGIIYWENIQMVPTFRTLKKSGLYHWEIRGDNSCSIFDSILVVADTSFNLSKTKDTTINAGASVVLFASSANAINYKWSPNKYIKSISGKSIEVHPSSDITYHLVATSKWGCQIKDSITIKVLKNARLKIPNILTVNGDGYNENWDLSMIKDVEKYTISIYNSEMKLVKQLKNYNNDYSFDGQQAGLYHYVIQNSNGSVYKGSIEVLK